MSKGRKLTFTIASIVLWLLLGFALWAMLETFESGCKLQEARSGLWAECFAPAAVVFNAIFSVIFLVDVVRTASVLWPIKPSKE
jgi:hypothetical protein